MTNRVLEINAAAKSDTRPPTSPRPSPTPTSPSGASRPRCSSSAAQRPRRRADRGRLARQADVAAGDDPRNPKPPNSPEKTRLTPRRTRQVRRAAAPRPTTRLQDEQQPRARRTRTRAHLREAELALNIGTGLIAGLFLGLGFVIVRALISDRFWKRQDIANALGARVRLSAGRRRGGRSRPPSCGRARRSTAGPVAVTAPRRRIGWAESPTPALAVVSVDGVRATARAVARSRSRWPTTATVCWSPT